jgi:hypothetical protein
MSVKSDSGVVVGGPGSRCNFLFVISAVYIDSDVLIDMYTMLGNIYLQ